MIHRRSSTLAALAALAACGGGEPPNEAQPSEAWATREGLGADQFVLIQPGTFQMGSTKGDADEGPVHTVNITKAFWLQKTEVTQGQWQAVMRANPSHFKNCGDACPVEYVRPSSRS
jgi:formylglycine-generating enzyme required for sulfatase activity